MPRSAQRNMEWVAIVIYLLLASRVKANDGLTLFIKRQFANNYLDLPVHNDLFLVEGGRVYDNSNRLLNKHVLPFGLKRIELTWFALEYTVDYSVRVTSSNLRIMRKPTISPIASKGVVSKMFESFQVTLPCTGFVDDSVQVNFELNYTILGQSDLERSTNRLQFSFTVHCNQSKKGNSGEETAKKSPNRTVVVTVSAVVACIFVVFITVVFFWRFIKRIRKKFGFDVMSESFAPFTEVSPHSSNISISPTPLPTVVYSPKRKRSPNTVYTKIAKHEENKEGRQANTTNSDQFSQSCPAHGQRSLWPMTSSEQPFARPDCQSLKALTNQSLSVEDDVFVSEQSEVALLQNDTSSMPSSLTFAKESHDKRQMYSTMNEYWTTELQDSLQSQDDVEVRSEIMGEGAFGRVYRGILKRHTGVDVAVKVCKEEIEFEQMVSCVNEAILIKNLAHDNLLDLLGVVLQPTSPPLILTPLMAHGDLHKFLRHSRGIGIRRQLIGSRQLVDFGTQIASGMEYLAEQKIVHRDLAARNCFVDDFLNVKIGDFGLARKVHQFDLYKMECPGQLAVKWLAIESLLYYIFTEKTDVWSFGILLWELVTLGSQPYAGLDNYEVTSYLETGKRLSRPLRCPDDLFAIMYSCWLPSPDDRPPFTVLVHKLQDYEERLRPSCIAFEFDEDTIEMTDECEAY